MLVGGQRHARGALPSGSIPATHWTEAGWAPDVVCTGPENLGPSGIRSPHRPASSETECDIPAHRSLGGFG